VKSNFQMLPSTYSVSDLPPRPPRAQTQQPQVVLGVQWPGVWHRAAGDGRDPSIVGQQQQHRSDNQPTQHSARHSELELSIEH
jgi:hypothetical protein